MPGLSRTLVIDARPRGPHGPMAGEVVLGQTVLAHLVETARQCGDGPIAVHARVDEHQALGSLMGETSTQVVFATGPPPEDRLILRTDRLYDPKRLRRVLRNGQDAESAVIWRLDQPRALESAGDELVRRRLYQPIGRFWALAPAKALAHALRPTIVRPNAVTIASAALMMASAAMVALAADSPVVRGLIAACLALGLVLDTADGHLARLQGTASEFGRWLDAMLDEAADMALHGAIAWASYARTGSALWLVVGMVYQAGKYLFVVAQQEGSAAASEAKPSPIARSSWLSRIVRMIGHADVRWHLWIALAAVGRLDLALVAYAIYFPVRTLAMAARKAVNHV